MLTTSLSTVAPDMPWLTFLAGFLCGVVATITAVELLCRYLLGKLTREKAEAILRLAEACRHYGD